jgi:hypothetical protein
MSTCEDCLYGNDCSICEVMGEDYCCVGFKDKSKFIELPCNVGDMVYKIEYGKIKNYEVWQIAIIQNSHNTYSEIILTSEFLSRTINIEDIGKTVFLTKEEAEKALAERSTPK